MTEKDDNESASYEKAGVNIEAGNHLVQNIKPLALATRRPEIMDSVGGFNALFRIPEGYRSPVLVTGTDGVGTKLKVAMELNRHDTIGVDLVAMCVNDLLCCGAEPLAFLDYYATGALDVTTATSVIKGIAEGCLQSGCALVGGETAEMPGMYQGADYDLAGFCVGVVEGSDIINGQKIRAGDQLIGIASSGPHSNGYSLIRHLIDQANIDYHSLIQGHSLADTLLAPTRIYVKNILALRKQHAIKGIIHVTGGGFYENIPRILPNGLGATIHTGSWPIPWVFSWLQSLGNIAQKEMYRTFNMGIGLVLCVSSTEVTPILSTLKDLGEEAWHIGNISPSSEIILE